MKSLAFLIGLTVTLIALTMLLTWPFMWMWNYAVVSALSNAQPISYWPSLCLLIFVLWLRVGSKTSPKN